MKWKLMEELIDTRLLAQMRILVFDLSEKTGKNDHMEAVTRYSFYWNMPVVERLEVRYGLRYPGEVLERYAEKMGDSIRILRTLAVAMAEMKSLLSESMFVENQYERFLQKVRKEAQRDLICKGSLFFLEENPEKKGAIRKALWEYPWNGIMELLCLLSIFREDGWERWKNSLVDLLGNQRKIEVYGNEGLFAWIIRQYEKQVRGYRKKDLNLLKGLCRLPEGNAMGTGPVRKWLSEAGYSDDEICFLNWGVLDDTVRATQISYPSIILERMAVQTCQRFFGSQKEYPQEVYELCTRLLQENREYDIKLEGRQGIFSTLENSELEVGSVPAYMTLWPYRKTYGVPGKYFWIDLKEQKWDVLRDKIGMEMFREKVVETLVEKSYSPEEFADCVKRYEELTGETLQQYLWKESVYPNRVLFQKMMEWNLIDASALADQYIQDYKELGVELWKEKWRYMFLNMKECLFCLNNEKSYKAFQKMINMFGIKKIDELLREERAFRKILSGGSRWGDFTEIRILSDCFDNSQNRQLFLWAEQYVYQNYPEDYPTFICTALITKRVAAVIEREVAVEMAKYLMEHSKDLGFKKEELRNLYWTEEERKKYEEEKEKEREEKERERQQEIRKKVEKEFLDFQKKMTGINQLERFLSYQLEWNKVFARQLITSYMKEYYTYHGFHTDTAGAAALIRLWATLYENGNIELEEVRLYINSMEVEE